MYEYFHKLGLTRYQLATLQEEEIDISLLARVISVTHENSLLQFPDRQALASISGKMRYEAGCAADFPAVGDWVVCSPKSDELITRILPRNSYLPRSAVGRHDMQILAANLDYAIVVTAADRDFNLARLDRYLALIHEQNIIPVIFLNKTDLIDHKKIREFENEIFKRHPGTIVFAGSVLAKEGLIDLSQSLSAGKTFCVIGSSGVGKSSLINHLASNQVEKTGEIGSGNQRGRHTTSNGQLHLLNDGSILIDTPGLREVGMTDAESGIQRTFAEIEDLASQCRFSDCSHESEPGCAVQKALAEGLIQAEKWESYKKLKREAARFKQTIAEKRNKEKKFSKMGKQIKRLKNLK
ncbi:MAG: ribosome small subunit-dependent GTPase A [Candidatus Rifleibacteriota bacterium]